MSESSTTKVGGASGGVAQAGKANNNIKTANEMT